MYLNHYQLALMPFRIGPDPKFLWLGSKHKKAYAILRYGIKESKGLVVITGEPGTGKSTILNAIIAEFGSNVRFAKIIDPALSEMDFFNFIASAFEMEHPFRNKAEFLFEFESLLKAAGSKKMVLVIDEAQRLNVEMLEQIRVFANAEEPGRKILSCIFAGQPEFLDTLRQNRALSQRIFFSHMIQPLAQSETEEYIAHRLKIAGRRTPIFTAAAVQEIFTLSGGIPRLINIACDKALLIGYAMNKKKIGPDLVREGAHNTLIPLAAPPNPRTLEMQAASAGEPLPIKAPGGIQPNPAPKMKGIRPAGHLAAYYAAIAILFAVGLSVFYSLNGSFRAPGTPPAEETVQAADRAQLAGPAPGDDDARRSQDQILELRRQKDQADARLKALQARVEILEKERTELQAARDRAGGLERAIAWKDAAIAELTHKLESSGSDQSAVLRKELESIREENRRLQAQLSAITNQKSAAEVSSGEVQKPSPEQAAYLKSANEQVARLEAAVSAREKQLALLEQKSIDLEKALMKEKAARDQINAELSSRAAAVAALQQKLETAESLRLKLEAQIQEARNDNARLQAQLQVLKTKRASAAAAAAAQIQPPTTAAPASTASPASVPDPASVIDYVIKKKSR